MGVCIITAFGASTAGTQSTDINIISIVHNTYMGDYMHQESSVSKLWVIQSTNSMTALALTANNRQKWTFSSSTTGTQNTGTNIIYIIHTTYMGDYTYQLSCVSKLWVTQSTNSKTALAMTGNNF